MAHRWYCPHGHRWEDALAGPLPGQPSTLCPICGAEGRVATSDRRQIDETFDAPVSTPERRPKSLDETLEPPSPSTADRISPQQALNRSPSPTDETLDRPVPPQRETDGAAPCEGKDPAVNAETLAVPAGKPTALPHPAGQERPDTNQAKQEALNLALGQTLDPPPSAPQGGMAAMPLPEAEEYQIVGELGRGGMGMVYKARQIRLNRIVALKMIRAGLHADPLDLLRFQREAEAVAQLQHPNIVQIYEVGERNGLPFFSLEYVDGGSLQQKLNGAPQPPRQTAALLEVLARAVEVAHQHGIIHRDLKPANILLTADGTPKITDFGLAKRLEEADTGQTGSGAILGTPTYMSPEQAQGKNRLIGPPADVYALGAILYDLLTGRPPFRGESVLDTLQLLQTTEPVPPTRLQPEVPRDLEIICLKCLQKEPGRRYTTAAALADDLHRFLNNRPILARKISLAERAWKWSKRRPAAAALVAVSILAVLALSLGGWFFAQRETWRATVAENLEQQAKSEQRRAEDNLNQAFESVDQLFLRISQERLLNEPRMEKVRRDILARALAFYERFLKDNPSNVNVLFDMARARRRMAKIYEQLNEPGQALTQFADAQQLFHRLAEQFPGRAEYRLGEAETHLERAVVLQFLGKYDEAQGEHDRAVPLLEALIREASGVPEYRLDLAASQISRAGLYQARQQAGPAASYYRLALTALQQLNEEFPEIAKVRLDLAATCNNLGSLTQAEDPAEAMRFYAKALNLLRAGPNDPRFQAPFEKETAQAYLNRGTCQHRTGERAQARESYEKAEAILRSLMEVFPYTAEYQFLRAVTQRNLGELSLKAKDSAKASEQFGKAYQLFKGLQEKSLSYAVEFAQSAADYATARVHEGDRVKALALFEEAGKTWHGLQQKFPEAARYQAERAKTHLYRGKVYAQLNQPANALREYGEAIALDESLSNRPSNETAHLHDLSDAYQNRAWVFRTQGKYKEADDSWQRAVAWSRKRSEASPRAITPRVELVNLILAWRGEVSGRPLGRRGCDLLEAALRELGAVVSLEPTQRDQRIAWHNLALLTLQQAVEEKDDALALRSATTWLDGWQKLPPLAGEDPGGTICVRAAEYLGRCMGTVQQGEPNAFERAKTIKSIGEVVMRLLRFAVVHGFQDGSALKRSEPLRFLRGRDDFIELLKGIGPGQAGAS